MVDGEVGDRGDRAGELRHREAERGDRPLSRLGVDEDPGAGAPRLRGDGPVAGRHHHGDRRAPSLAQRGDGPADEAAPVELEEGLGPPHAAGCARAGDHAGDGERRLALRHPPGASEPGNAS